MRRLVCLIKTPVFFQFDPTWTNSNVKPRICCETSARATSKRSLSSISFIQRKPEAK
jgi:hypothetical protein